MTAPGESGTAVVAVGGHESGYGRALAPLLRPGVTVSGPGRDLFRAVRELRGKDVPVCVVPMTLGRDPELIAETARTLRSLPVHERAGVHLAEGFGTAQHLTGWLRAAAGRVPARSALLVTAPSGDPFDDAELFRVARLVRQYGRHRLVEVALCGGDPGPAEGVHRCRQLGAGEVAVLSAAFTLPEVTGARAEPLLSASAVAGVLDVRVRDARHRWTEHGDDGLATGLEAARDHGHNHAHGPGTHQHGPGQEHGGPQTGVLPSHVPASGTGQFHPNDTGRPARGHGALHGAPGTGNATSLSALASRSTP